MNRLLFVKMEIDFDEICCEWISRFTQWPKAIFSPAKRGLKGIPSNLYQKTVTTAACLSAFDFLKADYY